MKRVNQPKNLSRPVLKNKISKELYLIGKNSIIEIFEEFKEYFESLIVSSSYNSEKIKNIVSLFYKNGIPVYENTNLLEFCEREGSIDTGGLIVILKKTFEKYYSFRDVREILMSMERCTVVALPELDYEQNLGVMVRTSLALGADFILVSNRQQKVFSPTVTKVSMGYNYVLPIVRENFLLAIDELKAMEFDVYGLDMGGDNIQNLYYNPKTCFVLGNEGKGLTDTINKKCSKIISIPMTAGVESLNVSTSLAVVLYDRWSKLNETERKV